MSRASVILIGLVLLFMAPSAQAQSRRAPRAQDPQQPQRTIDPFSLPHYSTKYYELYTDLSIEEAREVALHITKMAEVYAERTKDFSGAIRQKFPFVLFRNREDYDASGAPKGSAGYFNGQLLVGVAGKQLDARSWHVIQHEGFHQFAGYVIRGNLPTWVNEGLAEYFGEGVYAGDDIITGIVPKWRLKRVQKHIQNGDFKTADAIMNISLRDWNAEMDVTNYDQAWSMVHFLAHGDDGRYLPYLVRYMNLLASGKGHAEAWRSAFPDSRGFEERWKQYWLNLPDDVSRPLYIKATVSTLTGFLARAAASGQPFETFDEFAAAARGKVVLTPGEDDLPPTLLANAMEDVERRQKDGAKFSLVRPTTLSKPNQTMQQQVVMEMEDGRKFTGTYVLRNGKVQNVFVEITDPPKKK